MQPDEVPHRRYTVIFRRLDGSTKEYPVLTNRGPLKAVYMTAPATWRRDALDVEVRDDGPVEIDAHGVAKLAGYAVDRNEW